MKLLLILGLLLFPCAANAAVDRVLFPNMVTPQAVVSVAALPAGEGLALDFVTSSPTAQQVKMPFQGEFEVKIEAGPQFAVLDNDATDGLAVVQMPAQVMDIYLRPESRNGSLHFEDALYYHHQSLNALPQRAWYHLPGRAVPVPANWYSPDGQSYVWKLDNQGFQILKTRWKRAEQKLFPVGMKEIGPEGGSIELPGVSKLIIPAGALISSTIVKMSQQLSAPNLRERCLSYSPRVQCGPGEHYISPIVKLKSSDLVLQSEAFLDIYISEEYKFKNENLGFLFGYFGIDNIANLRSGFSRNYQSSSAVFQSIGLTGFGFYGKLIVEGFQKNL
ncbi:MAG: hypothetical protein ACO1RX_03100 [Candidatus Sericytochromatia bacterium]